MYLNTANAFDKTTIKTIVKHSRTNCMSTCGCFGLLVSVFVVVFVCMLLEAGNSIS